MLLPTCLPVCADAATPVGAVSGCARRMRVVRCVRIPPPEPDDARVCAYRDMRCGRVCVRVRVSTCEGVRVRGVWGCVTACMHICAYAHTCAPAGFVRWRDSRGCSSSPLRLIVHTHRLTRTHMRGGLHMRVPLHVHMLMHACACARVTFICYARMHVCMQARMSM